MFTNRNKDKGQQQPQQRPGMDRPQQNPNRPGQPQQNPGQQIPGGDRGQHKYR